MPENEEDIELCLIPETITEFHWGKVGTTVIGNTVAIDTDTAFLRLEDPYAVERLIRVVEHYYYFEQDGWIFQWNRSEPKFILQTHCEKIRMTTGEATEFVQAIKTARSKADQPKTVASRIDDNLRSVFS